MTLPRTLLRAVLATFLLTATVCVAAAVLHRSRPGADVPRPSDFDHFDGWAVRDARHVWYEGDTKVLSVTVDEAKLRRARLGIFRLGFAHRLTARNAAVDLLVDQSPANKGRMRRFDLRDVLRALGDPRDGGSRRIIGISVDGLRFRVTTPDGDWIEITADHCESGLLRSGRIALRGNVHVRDDESDRAFESLAYDPQAKRFVRGDYAARRSGDEVVTDREALQTANRSFVRVMGLEPTRLGERGYDEG